MCNDNLKRNWLVVAKMTWGIWRILTWALESLKNLSFNGLLLTKVCNVWAKKVQRSYLSWHWRVIQNLKKNWVVVWKMTWVIWRILTQALESFTKVYNVWSKRYRRVMLDGTENWCKIWRKTDLWFGKWREEFGKFS